MPSNWANFNCVFEVFQELFFAFLLERKGILGTMVRMKMFKIEPFQTTGLFLYSCHFFTLSIFSVVVLLPDSAWDVNMNFAEFYF